MDKHIKTEIKASSYESLCEAFGKEEVDKHLNKARADVISKHFSNILT